MGTNKTIDQFDLVLAKRLWQQRLLDQWTSDSSSDGLVNEIVHQCRRQSDLIPKFRDEKNGAIRILLNPLTPLAAAWLGYDPERYDIRDHREREEVAKIHPDGSYTATFPTEDGGTCLVNCYAYTPLKIATLSLYRRKHDDVQYMNWLRDQNILVEENGYAVCKGVRCVTVRLNGADFLRIFVSVSGATGEEDHECATAGAEAVQGFFDAITKLLEDEKWCFCSELEEFPDWEALGFKLVA